jgi:hypothetical protein
MCRALRGLTRLQCPQLQELNLFGNRSLDTAGVFATRFVACVRMFGPPFARPSFLLLGGRRRCCAHLPALLMCLQDLAVFAT